MTRRRRWVLGLPYTRPPLSANRRQHWSPAHRDFREVRDDLFYLGKRWAAAANLVGVGRADVTLIWYPGTNRRADSDNLAPTLKPILDGLVRAGVWADDASRFIRRTATEVCTRNDDPDHRSDPRLVLVIEEVMAGAGPGDSQQHPGRRARTRVTERHSHRIVDLPEQSVSPRRVR
jgi:hypothetical protein